MNTQSKSGPLTPRQLQRRKKMVVMPLIFMIFVGVMWLIFAPGSAKNDEQKSGLNSDLPTPAESEIVVDKREAYEQEAQRERNSHRSFSLEETLFGEPENGDPEFYARQSAMAPKPVYEEPFAGSANAYVDANRQLSDFYATSEPAVVPDVSQARIDELERKLAARDDEEEQLRLIEKSYEIASRYGLGAAENSLPVTASEATSANEKPLVLPVVQAQPEVVSRLGGAIPASQNQPRNFGFCGLNSSEPATPRNTISAVVHGDQTVTDGQSVRLRTGDAMRVGRLIVPAGTVITGAASVAGERLEIVVTAIEYGGNILPVELSVHDLDGQRGLRIPGSMELDAAKEIIGGMGQSAGTTISLGGRQSAGGQLLAELGRGVIQGTSQYVAKKAKVVKVKLRAGYKLFLLPKNN